MTPANKNTSTLCSDSHTSCGTAVTNEANVAPAPSATSNAGSAQQTRVPPLVNSDSTEASLV